MRKKSTLKEAEQRLQKEIEARRIAIEHVFTKGYVYAIRDINKGEQSGNGNMAGTTWSDDCRFRYIGKQGIHHCFQEVNGGWSRTYTDPQLVGKKIKEVDINVHS